MNDRSIQSNIDELKRLYKEGGMILILNKVINIGLYRLKYMFFLKSSSSRFVLFNRRILHFVMILMVHYFPEFVYLLSVRKKLPNRSQRIPKPSNILRGFELQPHISDKMPMMDNINIVMRGESFKRNNLSKLSGPVFLVNWTDKIDGKNIFYTTADTNIAMKYVEKKMFPLIFISSSFVNSKGEVERFHLEPVLEDALKISGNCCIILNYPCDVRNYPMGSGEVSIAALSFCAKKVTIYGWDQYLDFEPSKSSYWKVLFGLSSSEKSVYPDFKMIKKSNPDVLEAALYGWYFACRICELPFIINHGRLGQLKYHHKLIKKIERIFYKI